MSLSRESKFFAGAALLLAAGLAVSLFFNFKTTGVTAPDVPEPIPAMQECDILPSLPPLSVVSAYHWRWDNEIEITFNSPVSIESLAANIITDPVTDTGLDIYPAGYVSAKYSFKPAFQPDTMYRVTIGKGLADAEGVMMMDRDFNLNIVTAPLSPDLQLLSEGRIFPPCGNIWSLPFKYRKMNEINFTLYEGYANNQGTADTQSCSMSRKVSETTVKLPAVSDDGYGYFDLDLDLLLPGREPGFYILKADHPDLWGKTYPLTVSDIGISCAFADEKVIVSLHSLTDGTPIPGATVQLVSSKKQDLAEGESDSNGSVTLWFDLSADPGDYPELIKVYNLNDCNTLPCSYFSSSLNLSEFDLSGAEASENAIRAKIQPVRDLIRPGETIKIVMLLRDDITGTSPGIMPVGAAVYDTDGKLLQRELLECTVNGFADFDFHLPAGSQQGIYTICAGQPGSEMEVCYGSASVLSADFKPDTVRITLDDTEEMISGYAGYFFGQPVSQVPVTVNFYNEYKRFKPDGFPGYVFGAEPDISAYQPPVNGFTAETGKFSFVLQSPDTGSVPVNAVLEQRATVTVMPGASRPVSASKNFTIYPDRGYLGTLVSLTAPELLSVQWISIDSGNDAVPMECDSLNWKLERLEWEYSFVSTYSNNIRRQWVQRHYPAGEGSVRIDPGASSGSFTIPCPAADTNYLLTVTDPATGMQCVREVALVNEDAGIHSGNLMVIPFTSDAASYKPGDVALVTFELDESSTVTVVSTADSEENIYEFQGNAGTNIFEYTIPEDTVYGAVRLAFTVLTADPSGATEMRRSFGIASLNVDQSARQLSVSAEIPAETTPGSRLTIPVKTGSGEGTEIRAWAVNSGTLALTGLTGTTFFKHFHGPRLNTWNFFDCYSDLYPQFSLTASSLPGGDCMLNKDLQTLTLNQQPEDHGDIIAVPAVTDADGNCVLTIDVPDTESCEYTLFIAAGSDDAIGETAGRFIVREDFTPVLSLPRAAAGGDTFEAVFELFNHKSSDTGFQWTITVDGAAEVVSGTLSGQKDVAAGTSGTETLIFQAAPDADGTCTITATVVNNDVSATVDRQITFRPPVLPETRFTAATAAPGETVSVNCSEAGMQTILNAVVTIGSTPGTNLGSRLEWLSGYPYGCSEQLISRALPLLAAAPMIKLGLIPESFAPGAIDAVTGTLATLRTRQNRYGGIRMWDSDSEVSPDVTVYCGLLLTAAQERGIQVPENMLNDLCNYLEYTVMNSSGTAALERRALAGTVLARNGRKITTKLRQIAYEAQDAGDQHFAMALCGYALYSAGNGEDGLKFFREGLEGKPWLSSADSSGWTGSKVRRMGMLLAAGTEMIPDDENIIQLARELETISLADSATTQEMAWSAFALAGYASVKGTEKAAFTVTDQNGERSFAAGEQAVIENSGNVPMQIRNDGPGSITVTGVIRGITGDMQSVSDGISLTRRFLDRNGTAVTEVKRGDLFTMELVLTSLDGVKDDIVIAALLPGGVEAEDVRFVTREADGTNRNHAPRRSELLADRVLVFDSATPAGTVIHVPVRATSRGTYTVPAAIAEDMYAPAVRAVVPSAETPLTVQ